jgi:hypothetical protein
MLEFNNLSPSQYRQLQANENADGSQDYDESAESTSDSDDEDDSLPKSFPVVLSAASISHDQMFSQFASMTCQISALVEQKQRLELMSRKMARHSLDRFFIGRNGSGLRSSLPNRGNNRCHARER